MENTNQTTFKEATENVGVTETETKDLILLIWDDEIGKHRQFILNRSLQQPNEKVVYLHKGMQLEKAYEEEDN